MTKHYVFADDQVIIADSNGNLKRGGSIHITQHSESFGMEISAEKSGTMTFF